MCFLNHFSALPTQKPLNPLKPSAAWGRREEPFGLGPRSRESPQEPGRVPGHGAPRALAPPRKAPGRILSVRWESGQAPCGAPGAGHPPQAPPQGSVSPFPGRDSRSCARSEFIERYTNARGHGGLFCLRAGRDAQPAQGSQQRRQSAFWRDPPAGFCALRGAFPRSHPRSLPAASPAPAAPALPVRSRGPAEGKAGKARDGMVRHRPRHRPPRQRGPAGIGAKTRETASRGLIPPKSWSRRAEP